MARKLFIIQSILFVLLIFISCEKTPETRQSSQDKGEMVKRLLNLGNESFEKARYDNAITCYGRAIEQLHGSEDSNLINAYYNRGLASFKKGDYERAIEDFTNVVRLNPNDDRAYYNRGNALALKKFYEQAIEDYSRAIAINPEKAYLYYSRGLTYQEKKEYYDKAIDDFQQAIKINPEDKKAYCFLGITHYKKQDYRKAQKYFGEAIFIDPNYAEAIAGRGQAYLRSGKMGKALSDFKKACDMGEDTGCTMLELLSKVKKGPPDEEQIKTVN